QWQSCSSGTCSAIGGATSSTYTELGSDVGSTIVVVVTGTNSAGAASGTSAETGFVTALVVAPVNTAVPTISGSAQQGQTLSADPGAWSGSPATYGYQWR